jgi:hypothetical protein
LNVTYTYTVNNTGNTVLSNVTITDNVFGAVGGPITLNPGVSQTFTKIATITNDTTNIATATGTDQFGANVTATANATVKVIPTPAVGRMTGGGSVFNGTLRVTHGFELHCDASKPPNNLEVNWEGNRFHLENLTSATCIDDPAIRPNPPVAPFDTYIGAGIGNYNGVPGATAKWIFTDAGEPGTKDHANIQIFDANGNLVLSVSNFLDKGNQQAHAGDP